MWRRGVVDMLRQKPKLVSAPPLPDGHGALDGVVADEEVEDEEEVDAGEDASGVNVDLLHLETTGVKNSRLIQVDR